MLTHHLPDRLTVATVYYIFCIVTFPRTPQKAFRRPRQDGCSMNMETLFRNHGITPTAIKSI